MLEQLDAVPWATLLHAYGPATDVPEDLRALARGDEPARKQARHNLYGTIFHQGSRYQATPYAVPFLYELLGSAETPDKDAIIYLLVGLALGYEESCLPDGLPSAEFRTALTEAERQMSDADRAYAAEFGIGPAVDLACYDAVRQGVPTLQGLLDAALPVRTAAAYALAWFPEHAADTLPLLVARLATEVEPAAQATLMLAIGLLERAVPGHRALKQLRPRLDHDVLVLRVAAAIALARPPLEPRIVDVLTEALAAPEELQGRRTGVPFNEGHLPGYVSLVLARCGEHDRDRIVPALCRLLATVNAYHALDVTRALLDLVVGDGQRLGVVPAQQLDPSERQALTAVADHGGWRLQGGQFVNYARLVSAYGLPDSQAGLRAYLDG